ncbi:YjcZ family sporulation protein [Neobacillus drentensis]|nr:YjcZ family sporulation protein [Neobacillus drentensis]
MLGYCGYGYGDRSTFVLIVVLFMFLGPLELEEFHLRLFLIH